MREEQLFELRVAEPERPALQCFERGLDDVLIAAGKQLWPCEQELLEPCRVEP